MGKMMRVVDYVGKEAVHDQYGRVMVIDAPPRSKAMVNIKVLQRGKGWDELSETYKRHKLTTRYDPKTGDRSLRWGFTNSDNYGEKDTVHINTLELCN
jgi:hypothetical protein